LPRARDLNGCGSHGGVADALRIKAGSTSRSARVAATIASALRSAGRRHCNCVVRPEAPFPFGAFCFLGFMTAPGVWVGVAIWPD
jgi:hypothetical protein